MICPEIGQKLMGKDLGQPNRFACVVRIQYRPPDQEVDMASHSQALRLMVNFKHPNLC